MGLFRRRRRVDDGVVAGAGREGPGTTPASSHPVRVTGWDGDLPHLDAPVTVVVTSRSDRHADVPRLVAVARAAFGAGVDVRAVSYVADASPRDDLAADVPWVRPDPVDGIGSAINAGVLAGVGRTLVVVDTSVDIGPEALRALAHDVPGPTQARVRTAEGAARSGALLVRPGALPWSDDRDAPPDDLVFGADQPVVSMPQRTLVPAPCLPDERATLTAWTVEAAASAGSAVRTRDVGPVVRTVEPGRTVDAAVADVVASWRQRSRMPAGRLGGGVDPVVRSDRLGRRGRGPARARLPLEPMRREGVGEPRRCPFLLIARRGVAGWSSPLRDGSA